MIVLFGIILILLGIFFGIFFVLSPKVGIILTAILSCTQFWLTRDIHIFPEAFVYMDEFILIFLAVSVATYIIIRKRFRRTPIDVYLLGFVLVGIFSAIVNRTPYVVAIWQLRALLQYAIIFYAIVLLHFKESFLKKIIMTLVLIALFQIPVGVGQFIYGFDVNRYSYWDVTKGTMGSSGANIVGIFLITPIVFVIALIICRRKKIRKLFVILLGLFIPFVLCSSRFSYYILPLIILFVFRHKFFTKPKFILQIVMIGLILIGGIFLYVREMQVGIKESLGIEQLYKDQLDIRRGSGRLLFYRPAINILHKYSFSPFIGLGPGMFSSSTGYRFEELSYARLIDNIFGQRKLGLDMYVDSQIIATGVEFGYIGLFIFVLLILQFYRIARKVFISTPDPYWKAVAAAAMAADIVFITSSVVTNAWETHALSFWVWTLSGILLVIGRNDKTRLSRSLSKQGLI